VLFRGGQHYPYLHRPTPPTPAILTPPSDTAASLERRLARLVRICSDMPAGGAAAEWGRWDWDAPLDQIAVGLTWMRGRGVAGGVRAESAVRTEPPRRRALHPPVRPSASCDDRRFGSTGLRLSGSISVRRGSPSAAESDSYALSPRSHRSATATAVHQKCRIYRISTVLALPRRR
jgi:hypothetical protein